MGGDIHVPARPSGDDTGDLTKTELYARRKAPRVNVFADTLVELGLAGTRCEPFPVKTLAEYGAGFVRGALDPGVIGSSRQAILKFGEIQIPMTCRFLYAEGDTVGVEFVGPSALARSLIRTHFFLEFIAASLSPSVQALDYETEPCKALVYGREGAYGLEVIVNRSGIVNVEARLGHLGADIQWKGRGPLEVSLMSGVEASDEFIRAQLLAFLKNLGGMNPRLMAVIRRAYEKERMNVEVRI